LMELKTHAIRNSHAATRDTLSNSGSAPAESKTRAFGGMGVTQAASMLTATER